MNARDRLIQEFVDHGLPFHSRERSECWVDQLLAEHAHELAEKIRQRATPPEGHEWTVWNGGMEDAADLIDPEVSDG